MRVNEDKTQLLCISAAKTAHVNSYINASTKRIEGGSELKILGFHFGNDPSPALHVEKMKEKFRRRLWCLRHMKRSGMSESDLLFLYKTIILPVLDFATVAYHSMINVTQKLQLEHLQKRAAKIIFGIDCNYQELLDSEKLEELNTRRERFFVNFAVKASNNPRYMDRWSPLNPDPHYNIRNPKMYKEFKARTERLQNSPLFQLRKRLNKTGN